MEYLLRHYFVDKKDNLRELGVNRPLELSGESGVGQ